MHAESISEYLRIAADLRNKFGFKSDDRFGPWFRGQERSQWPLCPKLFREFGGFKAGYPKIEDEIREEFIVRAPVLCEGIPTGADDRTEWEWYFMMQHYGVPTRLLDWTEGELIALYFAVRNNPGHYDAAVWALDPFELNRQVLGFEETFSPNASGTSQRDKNRVKKWLRPRFASKPTLPRDPVAIYPAHVVRRISSQRSCFTVHGSNEKSLDNRLGMKNGCLGKIVIPSFKVMEVRVELERCGIDESTIFPDLDGLGRSICTNWRPNNQPLPHEAVNTRLGHSKVAIGEVGVIAIKTIKKGDALFIGDNQEMVWIKRSELPTHPPKIRKIYKDFAVFKGEWVGCPKNFNCLTMSWYLNEPDANKRPNVRCDLETYDFFALEDIKPGHELTVRYATYSDNP